MWDVPQEDAEAFLEEFKDLIEDIDGPGIFLHNAMIGLPMFIPGFGVAWGFFTSWQTGYAFAALVVTTPILAEIPAVALLYLSPFGLMELSAYALGMSRSFLLIHKIIKKSFNQRRCQSSWYRDWYCCRTLTRRWFSRSVHD